MFQFVFKQSKEWFIGVKLYSKACAEILNHDIIHR
jgi:hypothetical protein